MDMFDAINRTRSVLACKPMKAAEIINLSSDHVTSFLIAVGTAVKPAMSECGQLALSDVVVQDRVA